MTKPTTVTVTFECSGEHCGPCAYFHRYQYGAREPFCRLFNVELFDDGGVVRCEECRNLPAKETDR